jgi:hypothetical protein
MEQQMRKTYVEFKRARENATAAANLEQRAKAGLKHVADTGHPTGEHKRSERGREGGRQLPSCLLWR